MATGYQGQVAGKSEETDLRYGYDEPPIFEFNLSPWCGGGWTDINVAASPVILFGTPNVLQSSGSGVQVSIGRQLPFEMANITDAPGTVYSFSGIDIDYNRAAAGDVLTVNIRRKAKAGFGASATVLTWTQAAEFTVTGSVWTTFTDDASSHDFDFEAYNYTVGLLLTPSGAAQNMKVGDINLRITKKAVE